MAKQEQRRAAYTLFVEQGKTRKDIAALLKVRENTVGKWATDGNWEELRTQRLMSSESVITTLKQLMDSLGKQRLAMEGKKDVDASEKARITDELSKVSKSLSEAKDEGELTLNARLTLLEWVFSHLRKYHPGLHDQLVDVHLELIESAAALHA